MADTSFADVDLEAVLLRLTRYAQALFGASRVLGFDAVNVSYPGGEGPEDLAMNLVVRLLDPADNTVEWKDKQWRPNTERVFALLRKALERDFLDLKKSKRYKTTVQIDDQAPDDSGELSLDQMAVYLETPEGLLLKKERVRAIIEAFSDDPKAEEIVRLQLDPEGYNAFTNQELAALLETSVDDIENRKKRVRNRLLQILRRQEKGTGTYV
jgi:DNA-directed RNA polymerase specialized sigma24 family protein